MTEGPPCSCAAAASDALCGCIDVTQWPCAGFLSSLTHSNCCISCCIAVCGLVQALRLSLDLCLLFQHACWRPGHARVVTCQLACCSSAPEDGQHLLCLAAVPVTMHAHTEGLHLSFRVQTIMRQQACHIIAAACLSWAL